MSDMKVGPKVITQKGVETTTPIAPVQTVTTEKTTTTTTTTTTPPVSALFSETRKESTTQKPAGTLKPHEALMTSINKPRYASFAAAFTSVVGKSALDEIKAAMGNKPIVLIAGDQCTGKGTAAEGLVVDLGGGNTGTGTVLRALAQENGLSIEQMSAMLSGKSVDVDDANKQGGGLKKVSLSDYPHLGTAEDVDVRLDFRAAKAIGSSSLTKADGKSIDVTVFESRLAGHLGQFLEGLGRENIVSVYLYAAPRVQAERYLDREVWKPAEAKATTPAAQQQIANARAKAADLLKSLDDAVPLAVALQKLVDGLRAVGVPGLDVLAAKVSGIAGRDDNDKTRLLSLYGVNYQDRSAFDVVVDTNGKTPAQVKQAILDAVAKKSGDGVSPFKTAAQSHKT
jgi:cytidylate kinase